MSAPARRPPVRRPNPARLQPSEPLSKPSREIFAQMIAEGVPVPIAYERAGYSGGAVSRSQLRHAADVDGRVRWLLAQRIEQGAEARRRGEKTIEDARLRLIRHLEAIAYSDPRDIVQWDVEPIVAEDGTVTGERPVMRVTPSHLLTREQAAQVRSVAPKSGGLRFDTTDKMAALAQLARILGLVQPDAAPSPSTTINATQVNVSAPREANAFELARRLAFALEKAARALPAATAELDGPILEAVQTHAPSDGSIG